MKTSRFCVEFRPIQFIVLLLAALIFAAMADRAGAATIVNVVETGGENQSGDTVTAKWTGQTWSDHANNEPVPGLAPGTPYTVGVFTNYAPTFVDRNHRYTNAVPAALPPYLAGKEYIMCGNDNRGSNAYRLDVTVSSQVAVYMLIDNRLGGNNADPPTFGPSAMQWILDEGWLRTSNGINRTANSAVPDEVAIDEGADGTINQWFSVYVKTFPAGTFQLKQPDNAGQNMYGVVIVDVGPSAPPPAPTNVVATSGDTQVTLTWASAQSATGYNIKRSAISGGPYTIIGTVAGTTFTDSPLANAVDYFYVVSGTNILGEGTNSAEVVGHPNPVVTGVTAVGGTNQIALDWFALLGADSYTVSRATVSGGPYVTVASGITATNYVDTTVLSGRTYYYRVTAALGAAGPSGQSAEVSAFAAPGAPNVTATLLASTVIRLAWTSDPVVSGFVIEQSTDGVNFAFLDTTTGSQRSYTNSGLSPSTTYFYRVQANNAVGASPFSTVVSNTTPAIGWNVNFQLGTAPVPPGYLKDIGDIYGDRTNGFFYGWTNIGGTNITVDGRWRQNLASPDLRYDTFMHMMRINIQNPALSSVWEIEIPNGFYSVRIVSGDSDNFDGVFQFDVEGALTSAYTPTTTARWGDMTIGVGVSDGRLTINSGPAARNNKIAFVDIYPAIPTPPVITAQPQSVIVEQNRPAALSATATGSAVLMYQWYLNDTPVPGATSSTLAFARPQPTNSGSYYVVVTNYGGVVTSQVATLTVNADATPPYFASVASLDGRTVGICFNEELDNSQGVVTDAANYSINDGLGAFIQSVVLRPDGRSVTLVLSESISNSFLLTAFSQRDLANNLADTIQTNVTVLGFTAGDVGGPAFAGSHFSCDGDTVEVVGGGVDVWGAADQAYLITRTAAGDFDARIRVNDLRGSNAITKAVLVARESRNADSRGIHISVNPPPPGRNQVEMGLRPTTGGATVAVGASFIPAGVPNAWMRITRAGDIFTGYRSTNGVNWIQLGQTNVSFPPDLVVGFGVSAHDTNLLATGILSGFTLSQPVTQAPIINPSFSPVSGFSAAIQTQNGVTYTVQFKNDLSAPSWSPLTTFIGNGTVQTFNDPATGVPMRFYRVIVCMVCAFD